VGPVSDVLETVLRTIGGFALILLLERLLGKRTIAKMSFRDFVGATMAGTVAANMAFNLKVGTWVFVLSLILLGLILTGITRLELKSGKARKLLDGEPVPLVENGKILPDRLKKQKLNEELLLQQLRCKDIFDIREVEKAFMEPNGKISILKKKEYRETTYGDLQGAKNPRCRAATGSCIFLPGRMERANG
jgi:uncharacterized membrane protein YcaP (DUF421 family)